MNILEKFGKEKYGNRYLGCDYPDNQPFTIIRFINDKGEEDFEEHSFFHLEEEYAEWKKENENRLCSE